jgi:hypothetical protein
MRRGRSVFFDGFWTDLNGKKLRRITHAELREIWRLWSKHRDIREGRVS